MPKFTEIGFMLQVVTASGLPQPLIDLFQVAREKFGAVETKRRFVTRSIVINDKDTGETLKSHEGGGGIMTAVFNTTTVETAAGFVDFQREANAILDKDKIPRDLILRDFEKD